MKLLPDPNPKLIYSPHSGPFEKNGHRIVVCIFRFEDETEWTLEVEDAQGNSTVWNEEFESDEAAWTTLLRTIEVDGIEAFAPLKRREILN